MIGGSKMSVRKFSQFLKDREQPLGALSNEGLVAEGVNDQDTVVQLVINIRLASREQQVQAIRILRRVANELSLADRTITG